MLKWKPITGIALTTRSRRFLRLVRHHRSMMTEAEIHKGLLAIRDREYRFLLNFFKNAGFDLPLQGPIAYRWAEAEAGAGNVRAQFCAAKLLKSGLFVKEDKLKARAWCEMAAKEPLPQALTMLGGLYESGSGDLVSNPAKAIELWQAAAALEETGAMCALAGMYLDGRFLNKDRDAGLRLLRRAATAGDELAQGELANLLIVEKEPASEAEGLHWLKAAAERGLASLHRHLGHFYRRGEHGLPVDLSQSRAHFAAAEKLEMEYL